MRILRRVAVLWMTCLGHCFFVTISQVVLQLAEANRMLEEHLLAVAYQRAGAFQPVAFHVVAFHEAACLLAAFHGAAFREEAFRGEAFRGEAYHVEAYRLEASARTTNTHTERKLPRCREEHEFGSTSADIAAWKTTAHEMEPTPCGSPVGGGPRGGPPTGGRAPCGGKPGGGRPIIGGPRPHPGGGAIGGLAPIGGICTP